MTAHADLVARLRADDSAGPHLGPPRIMLEAADALEAQAAEIARLTRIVELARALANERVLEDNSTDEPPEAWWDARDALRAALAGGEGK